MNVYSGRLNKGMYNSQSEEMYIMMLHKDGFTIPGLNLAMFILRTWHLIACVCIDFP